MNKLQFDNIYKYAADEAKKRGPSPEQKEFANHLTEIGRWDLFMTCTFRPNKNEEIVQSRDGEFYRNEKLTWCGGKRVPKRKTRNGGLIYGTRSVAPGWGKAAALRQGRKFMHHSFRRSRWIVFVEGSKYRNCAHLHALVANAPRINPEVIAARWDKMHGRCDIEAIQANLGLAHYLCKGYVAKNYGKTDELEFEHSKNCFHAHDDKTPSAFYHLRQYVFRLHRREGPTESWLALKNGVEDKLCAQEI